MKILFDAYWIENGPPSGRMLLREIIANWATEFPEDSLIAVIPRNTTVDTFKLPPRVQRIESRLRYHPLINAIELPRISRSLGDVDAIVAHNFAALAGNSFVFIQDVLFRSNPEWFTRTERLYFSLMGPLAKHAALVFSSSNTEKSRMLRFYPRIGAVAAVGLGLPRVDEGREVRHDGVSEQSYILTVGRLNIRKNLTNVIEGSVASGKLSPEFPLIIVGERSGKSEQMTTAASDAIEKKSVRFLGYVDDEELAWLYRNCSLFCCLSLDEGYGLPPLEAAQYGANVLVSDIDVFHETMGRDAEYVNPTDVSAIGETIARVLESELPKNQAQKLPSTAWPDVVDRMRTEISKTRQSKSVFK